MGTTFLLSLCTGAIMLGCRCVLVAGAVLTVVVVAVT
jgi:hypothetical protein